MTSTGRRLDRDHPILAAVSVIGAELGAVEHAPAWSLSDDDTRRALVELTRLEARVSALQLKVAAQADRNQVGDASGATSAGVWWANHTRMTQAEAHRKVKLAKALERHEQVGDALVAGDILVDQGRRILDVVAPEVGEAEETKRLAAEERRAEQAARLTMHDDGHGQTHGRFTIPTGDADTLRKAVQALASPKAGGHGLNPHGMGMAFLEYIRRYPADRLPYAGGMSATVVVMMDYETLMGGLKAAQLDTGTMISPGHARKLACEAGIIPAVLDGDSQPLDVGRASGSTPSRQRHGRCRPRSHCAGGWLASGDGRRLELRDH